MIQIKNLTKVYNSKTIVFKDFNYRITKNLFLLIGPNGSGKTTLLNCISNYTRYQGTISYKGIFSYLPERRGFADDVIAKDLIKLITRFYKTDISKYIEQLNFKDYMKKKINDLSKGNKTKLFMLTTLAKPANIYLFDEPTDGLDIKAKEEFIKFCRELSEKFMVIVSTHDFGVIDKLKGSAQVLDLGKVKKC